MPACFGRYFKSGELLSFDTIRDRLSLELLIMCTSDSCQLWIRVSSLLPGNLYLYFSIKTEIITRSTRYPLFAVFSVVSAVGLALFAVIIWRTYIERRRSDSQPSNSQGKIKLADILQTLKVAVRLLRTRQMLLLLIPFAYTGELNDTCWRKLIPLNREMNVCSRFLSNLLSNCVSNLHRAFHQVWRLDFDRSWPREETHWSLQTLEKDWLACMVFWSVSERFWVNSIDWWSETRGEAWRYIHRWCSLWINHRAKDIVSKRSRNPDRFYSANSLLLFGIC